MKSFDDFLAERLAGDGFSTEDALASFLPLLAQAAKAQQQGRVAPLAGTASLCALGGRLYFAESELADAKTRPESLARMTLPADRAVDIVAELETGLSEGETEKGENNLWIGKPGEPIDRPVYLPGYVSWEHELGHHDSLTDGFCLGMILASLSCGLDFHKAEDLREFVTHRGNLFARWPNLHPVIAKAIYRMTELQRDRRPQDLSALLASLENYREQDGGFDMDLARAGGLDVSNIPEKREAVLATLQQRLFEISRRNRLLHFRQTMQSVNLSWASVPLSFDARSIRPSEIFTWNEALRKQIAAGTTIPLDRYLRFEEAVYLPPVLDRIRREARRDATEFGFAQLRFVLCFLRWSNLKETPPERFESPLALLPVELLKEKGVRDRFGLRPLSAVAEINPVIRHYFQQLYGLKLPAEIDLAEGDLSELHAELSQMIQKSEPGVELHLVDRPRIRVIQAKAKRRLDNYRRRARLVGPHVKRKGNLEYSYHEKQFEPLGLKLFETHLEPMEFTLEQLRSSPVPIWNAADFALEETATRQVHQLVGDDEQNPYAWEMDLCSLTLGNFRYRKMSLVRDYDEMRANASDHPPFDAVFSLKPRPPVDDVPRLSREEDRTVLASDPTQASAIAKARGGGSYIIQGPPGTGKSQTITNLIADFVGRGKRVLFVCEKRAAIDVVHHRLKQVGLAALCSLIHDSQADKKAFVMDLKATYETFQEPSAHEETNSQREKALTDWEREATALTQFAETMASTEKRAGVSNAALLTRAIELADHLPDLLPAEREQLPDYADWAMHRERVDGYLTALLDVEKSGVLAKHPFRLLRNSLLDESEPINAVAGFLAPLSGRFEQIFQGLSKANVNPEALESWNDLLLLAEHAAKTRDLAKHELLGLLAENSREAAEWSSDLREHQQLAKDLEEARGQTRHWREKLPKLDLATALDQARRFEGRLLRFFNPGYWRLRKVLNRCYDFSAHAIKPGWVQVLELLQKEYDRLETCETNLARLQSKYHFEGDAETFDQTCRTLRHTLVEQPAFLKSLFKTWINEATGGERVVDLAEAGSLALDLTQDLKARLVHFESLSPVQLRDELKEIESQIGGVPDFVYCLKSLAGLPARLQEAFRTIELPPEQLEAAIAAQTLEQIERENLDFKRFDDQDRARHVERLDRAHRRLQEINAGFLYEQAANAFRENLRLAGRSDSELSPEQKEFKKQYNRGRKILEHEFGKQMRYKPIRDLATGESGLVVRDLKPVWLMSPLSVADTLPLDPGFFDVIIFDEASQITLEEAMPSVFRANQIIVVGDEMQLPPTSFFSSRSPEEEDSLFVEDDEGEAVAYDLDGNSFLSHAARNLPATMLGWHYRSRSESLISFSNAAFYQGRLLTVPEETLIAKTGEIRVASADEGFQNIRELMARAVSFHYLEAGCYENRRNTPEAEYIAQLVRGLLLGDSKLTAGIVAFSEAQQDEIEQALKQLAESDRDFGDRLEAEWEREDDGQFAGLLVKNLENIQGDERDVIILSVCYGPSADGRMRMHFGPINQSGGEKRLNVAFSRSKHHMAVVSSIRHEAITNDYNTGAKALKDYLHYAEAQSAGHAEAAQRILDELAQGRMDPAGQSKSSQHPVLEQIEQELERRGYRVDRDVGQSQFRCHLAVYQEGDTVYRLGILVDTDEWYQQAEVLEREVLRPKLLDAFGWNIAHVLVKDWHHRRQEVIARLEEQLRL